MKAYMKRFHMVGRAGALAALTLSLSACSLFKAPNATPRAWQDEVIYFAMTDRFANGTPANDNGPNRDAGDRADRTNPWRGTAGTSRA